MIQVALHTSDVGIDVESPQAFADHLISLTITSWDEGCDLVVFPEYTWLVLEQFAPSPITDSKEKVIWVAECFWTEIFPQLQEQLSKPDKAVVLGTVPFFERDSGKLLNRAPIIIEGQVFHQDKLNLTPWEDTFQGGADLHVFQFRSCRFSVIICLDIEVPELAVALRGAELDLIIVPSATENILGVERVGRCASARAVELCVYVGVCHLTGKTSASDLVDENMGRLSWYAPSQSLYKEAVREDETEVFVDGIHRKVGAFDPAVIARLRKRRLETNPALLTPTRVRVKCPEPSKIRLGD